MAEPPKKQVSSVAGPPFQLSPKPPLFPDATEFRMTIVPLFLYPPPLLSVIVLLRTVRFPAVERNPPPPGDELPDIVQLVIEIGTEPNVVRKNAAPPLELGAEFPEKVLVSTDDADPVRVNRPPPPAKLPAPV